LAEALAAGQDGLAEATQDYLRELPVAEAARVLDSMLAQTLAPAAQGSPWGRIRAISDLSLNVMDGMWPEADRTILALLDSPWPRSIQGAHPLMAALDHVRDTLRAPWPDLEPILLAQRCLQPAIDYAETVRPQGWPDLEARVLASGSPSDVAMVAQRARAGRWLEAEPALLAAVRAGDPNAAWAATTYASAAGLGRWPEAEAALLSRLSRGNGIGARNAGIHWASDAIGGRWPELEGVLVAKGDTSGMIQYLEALPSRERRRIPMFEAALTDNVMNAAQAARYASLVCPIKVQVGA
jgi:hypothetical protein